MRILNLRFKNLNSLVGEWSIDFTNPAFQSEGIFAITGPTGAGKSTILDALCLGLFGRTPRLERINESNNEIMSRHTWECFSEVTFAVPCSGSIKSTIYKTHWHQRKAGKKETGRLQGYSFEIAEVATGAIITSKKSEVAKEVEHLTGMDFDRFTRSMMLAQGGFAAFLQAKAEDRSPLLEQITGTEIYTDISCMVHEKKGKAEVALKEREQSLQGLFILSEEEMAHLFEEKKEYSQKEKNLADAVEKTRTLLSWFITTAQLQKEITALALKQKDLATQKEAFAEDAVRLGFAKKTQEFTAEYVGLMELRKNQKEIKEQITLLLQKLPLVEQAELTALTAKTLSFESLQKAREEQEKIAITIKEVRALDERIALQRKSFGEAKHEYDELEKQKSMLIEQEKAEKVKESFSREQLALCQKSIERTKEDAALIEQFAGIKAQFASLYTQDKQVKEKCIETNAFEDQQKNAVRTSVASVQKLEEQKTLLAALLKEQDTSATRLRELLQGHSYEELLAKKHAEDLRIKNLADTANTITSITRLIKQKEALEHTEQALLQKNVATVTHKNTAVEKRDALIRERDLLENQLFLLSRIASFEEERKKLQQGEACPLCGSFDHPFATQETQPEESGTKERLATIKRDVDVWQQELQAFEQILTANKVNLEHARENKMQAIHTIQELRASLENVLATSFLPFTAQDFSEESLALVQQEIEQTREHIDKMTMALEKASMLRDTYEKGQKSIETCKERVVALEKESKAAELEEVHLRERYTTSQKEYEGLAEGLRIAILDIQDMLTPYGTDTLMPFSKEKGEQILVQLENRKEAWVALHTEQEILAKAVEASMQARNNLLQKFEENKKSLAIKETQASALKNILEQEQQKRSSLFGSQNPDEEEAHQKNKVLAAEAYAKKMEHEYSLTAEKVRDTQRDKKFAEEKLQENLLLLEQAEPAFLCSIQRAGFTDEKAYEKAILPVDEREALEKKEALLTKQSIELSSLLQEKRTLLAKEQEKYSHLPESTTEESLTGELVQQDEALADLRKALGSIEQRIVDNNANKRLRVEEQAILEKLKTEVDRWRRLHLLIGSADGKKFRNYAQGLTFEVMVVHANIQLQKMNDRYVLTRDKVSPLELNVIDTYQAGEERSTRNLSGGESFIISLALALGLSAMASGTMRVDSLFLDEGFGALDEDTLETALDTLAGLRQEGKLIGLISHIGALKERIGLQLTVRPVQGGKSELSGAGVAFLGM